MSTKIQLRRDTSTNWTRNNPVLALGEPGLETDTLIVKYGDGASTWNELQYANLNSLSDFTTTDLVEGSNLYYSNARVQTLLNSTTANLTLGSPLRLPSYTYSGMINIVSPRSGQMVFETSNNVFRGYNGTTWSILG